MKSKLIKTSLILACLLGTQTQLFAMEGTDPKNPCGALLCVLGGQTGGECAKYYQYYTIGISKECKGRPDCIAVKQVSHLKNCKMQ
ncbi:hypothetical protein [Campylobacter sp. MIT 97-5078]|nr:hypothetical protein [Campylobacter sp. MIT 97-5078]